jgi:hypothetical protein
MKSAVYSALRLFIDGQRIVIPEGATELIRELLLLRVSLGPTGNERIEAAAGGHDDLADALAFSLGPYKDRDGHWRTHAGTLLDPRRERPAPSLTADDLPTVTTPGGVVVPAGPVFQSVTGRSVADPAGIRPERAPLRVGDFTVDPYAHKRRAVT